MDLGKTMNGWIIYEREAAAYNRRYISFYEEECRVRGIQLRLILTEELDFGVKNGALYLRYQGEDVAAPDFAFCRAIYPLLSKHLELMGVRVFNRSEVAKICNDKSATYQMVASAHVPIVESRFLKREYIPEFLKNTDYPGVLKTVNGHGGAEVFLLKNFPGEDVLSRFRANDAVWQPRCGCGKDLRVYVVGNQIIAAVMRESTEGFRANYSQGGKVSLYSLSEDEKKIVEQILSLGWFDFVGIDFIIGDYGELIFNEIEDIVGSRMLYAVSDLDIVHIFMDYVEATMKQR